MTIYCTYCGQGFARNEHLQRHILTHTDLRPFECPVCHLTFKRRDLLKKHFIAHGPSETSLSAQDAESARALLASRVRTTAACSNCAQTKTKCDNSVKQPCSRCRARNLTCTARPTRTRGPRPKQPGPTQNQNVANGSTDGAENGESLGGGDGPETPVVSCSAAENETPPTVMPEREYGPSITVAASTTATATSPWNNPSDAAGVAFEIDFNHEAPAANSGEICIMSNDAGIDTFQYGTSPVTANTCMQDSTQSASSYQQSDSVSHSNMFPLELFGSSDSLTGTGPVMYGPSWALANSPERFFDTGYEVFGPFLGFANPVSYSMDAAAATSPAKDVVMRGSEGFPQGDTLCPVPESQQQLGRSAADSPKGKSTDTSMSCAVEKSPVALGHNQAQPFTNSFEQNHKDPWDLPNDVGHWTMFQCCPVLSTVAPVRAVANLSFLEENSRMAPSPWSVRSPGDSAPGGSHALGCFNRVNVSLSPLTRERMSAITQSFFPKALETHGLGATSSPSSHRRASEWFGSSGFILLPPTEDLEVFFENYMNYVEPYYPLVPTRTLDPNELLVASGNEKGATLLLLLMVSIGANCNPASRARRLGAGLAEMCRISLTDLVEKDNEYSTVPIILQCSLLLTIQSCWGGDKWQMDIGAGHRFMYIAMLRNSGYFQGTVSKRFRRKEDGADIHTAWRIWVEQEGRRRLAYDWVMLDQELSLFYDQPPTFAITELKAPLPDVDEFWLAKSPMEWMNLHNHGGQAQQDLSEILSSRTQYSLRHLFQLCLANELDAHTSVYKLTPIRLRLLLYPIQCLVFHHTQLLDIFPDRQLLSNSFNTTTRTSCLLRLEELQHLLQTWWALSQQPILEEPPSSHDQTLARASFILFHLISLNLYTGLKAIESFARGERECGTGEDNEDVGSESDARHKHLTGHCIYGAHDALYHAGQVLRLVRENPVRMRPPWWAAAVYRVSLVLWAYSISQATYSSSLHVSRDTNGSSSGGDQPTIRIDAVMPTDPAVARFLRHKRGIPILAQGRSDDAAGLRLDNPQLVLRACIDALDGGESCTWFAMGVKLKLETLLKAWSGPVRAGEEAM